MLSGGTKGCKHWTLVQAPGASPTAAALPPSRPRAVGSCHPQLPPAAGCSILMRSKCYFTLSLACISQMVMKVKPLFYVGFLTQQITTNFHNLKQDELMIAQSWRSEFQPGSRWARIRVSAGLCSSRSLQERICSSPSPASGGAEFPQLVPPPLSSAALSGRVSALPRGIISPASLSPQPPRFSKDS